MKAVIATRPGGPDVLELVRLPDPVPEAGEVLMRVHATAVNRADILQRMGHYPPPPGVTDVLGLEAAGEVIDVGPAVEGWQVGDRVMALLAGGGYAELAVVPQGQLMPIPDRLDWILAAATPEAYLTAWQALDHHPRPQHGSWVLVHAAASGVGLAALDISRALGARTVATTRSTEKSEILADIADEVVVPAPEGFRDQVMRATGGHGADVVIDLVGAPYWADTVACTAVDGRIALLGLLGGARTELDLAALMARRLSVTASTLRARPLEQKAEIVRSFADWGLPKLADGTLRPRVHDMFPLTRAADAQRLIERNETVGKVVLAVSADGLVDR